MNTPATVSPAFAPQPLPQAGFTLARNAHGRLVLGLPDGSAHGLSHTSTRCWTTPNSRYMSAAPRTNARIPTATYTAREVAM